MSDGHLARDPFAVIDEHLQRAGHAPPGNPWFERERPSRNRLSDEDPNRLCGVCERPLRECQARCRLNRSEDRT